MPRDLVCDTRGGVAVGRNPDEEDGRETDDLADRLIDKREKLQYFVVTGSTAILAFTIGPFGTLSIP
jgi:hypothetical protein